MTQVDTSIPTFLKRKPGDAPLPTKKAEKSAVDLINEARKKDGLRPYAPGKTVEAAAAVVAAVAKSPAKRTAMEKQVVKLAVETAKAPKKAGKLVEKALQARNDLAAAAKKQAEVEASKPKTEQKKGWPREGSKNAILLDAAIKAGKNGSTWDALAKKVGWQRCSYSLKTLCKQVGARLEERNDRVYVTAPK